MKDRTELGEGLGRRIPTRPFVLAERHLANLVRSRTVGLHRYAKRQRRDLVGKAAGVDGRDRALVAAERKCVLLIAADLALTRMILRNEAGAQIDVRIAVDERRV